MQTKIELNRLAGKWYVLQSNFGMWLKGDKTNPAFNYTIAKKYGVTGLNDEVSYTKNGMERSVKGFDVPKNELNTAFLWRSNFLFGLVSSRWQVIYYDPSFQWLIIRFSKTLFTKAGEDVITREQHVPDEMQKNINDKLSKLGIAQLKRL